MKLLCMENDLQRFGFPFSPVACRYAGNSPTVSPGVEFVMSALEPAGHWDLRPGAPVMKRDLALKVYSAFLEQSRDAIPDGVMLGQWSIPCYWTHHWHLISEAQREAAVAHWIQIVKALGLDYLAVSVYDAQPNAFGLNVADPHGEYERWCRDGRLDLARRVATALGIPCYVVLWHRQKGLGAAASLCGRALHRHEILAQLQSAKAHGVDGAILWQGDESFCAIACNPGAGKDIAPAAIAAMREQWAPEVFGDEPPVWSLETLPRVQHVSRLLRQRWGDLVVATLGGVN